MTEQEGIRKLLPKSQETGGYLPPSFWMKFVYN